ncbi:MAG: TetR/AcrR family transcriptional regulator [Gemmatimonadales bacterium]
MATRESILDVAARLYADHGWRGTTTRGIADAAGVNEVTVFRLFGSKESLLIEAIGQAAEGDVGPRLPDVPKKLRAELVEWALARHAQLADKRGMIRSCLAEWEEHPDLAPKVCRGGQDAAADLRRYLAAARRRKLIGAEGPLEAATKMFVNAVFMDAMMRDVMPAASPGSDRDTIATFADVILRGLGAVETA